METVEIVIRIPKDTYDEIMNMKDILQVKPDLFRYSVAIANGTVLPKGHGDLKDVNDLKAECVPMRFETDSEDWLSGYPDDGLPIDMIDEVPTIIEADMEDDSDGKSID